MSAFGGKADIAAKLLTHHEARRIAANIAKLPELFKARLGGESLVPITDEQVVCRQAD